MAPATRLDGVFAALANPARRAMVERLGRGAATTSELASPHDMSLSAVLQHLELLEAAGVVKSAKRGRVRTYRLHARALEGAQAWLAKQQERFWSAGLQALDSALREDDPKP